MAKIDDLIGGLTGETEEEFRLKEQYSFLQKMASTKSQAFENRLKLILTDEEKVGTLKIVGDKAFKYHSGQHVNILPGCDAATLIDEISGFFDGDQEVKKGFQVLVKRGLSSLIDDTSIGETEKTMVFVIPKNCAIVRVDMIAYKYTFSSKRVLASNVENICVYTMAESFVDYKKVGVDDLMYAVVDMMRGDSDENPSLDEVMPFIRNLQATWRMLDGESTPSR